MSTASHFLLLLALFIAAPANLQAQVPAFPGAEGYGAVVTGGRGGVIREVTTLADDVTNPPVGSLRAALKDTTSQPLTIVFRVSGIITLQGRLDVARNNVTIAGQTAPGDGICLKRHTLKVYGRNIIIRYIRSRPGEETHSNSPAIYGIDCENANYVIIDHCSFSWSIEEVATFYDNHYTTLQWCIISEGLNKSYNTKGAHGYAGVWGGQYATYHHNLIAHNYSRNVRFNGARAHDTNQVVDYRNNVIYNWQDNSAYGGEIEIANGKTSINMVNNYYKYGPATTSTSKRYRIVQITDSAFVTKPGVVSQWYITGNYVDGYPAVTADNWSTGVQVKDTRYSLATFKAETPFDVPAVNIKSAVDGYTDVLAYAGATFPKRDTVDMRVVSDVINRTALVKSGMIDSVADVGGYPVYNSLPAPLDTDHDGMPDDWETAHGLNPNDDADRNLDFNGNGYTNVEKYLNELAAKGQVSSTECAPAPRPKAYKLSVNYPNPFNPSTTIQYQIPYSSSVSIKVFNIVGKEVATLVNELKPAGYYEVSFDASKLTSGVYFYTIRAGNFIQSKKMMLVK